MNKVELYIRKMKSDRNENRYYSFDRLASLIPIENNSFSCPYCGARHTRFDWDSVDELEPRCLYCRELIIEIE